MAQNGYSNTWDGRNFQQSLQNSIPYRNNLILNSPYDNYMGNINQQNTINQFLKCRPVASREEARAFQIDLDGSLWVFTDIGNEKIYTKQINNDGTAVFKTYVLTQDNNESDLSTYVTREEFNNVVQTLIATMNNNSVNSKQQKEEKQEQSQIAF